MGDWNIDVGFNTEDLKSATSGSSGGGSSGGGNAFASALKGTGLVALLMSLKPILDIISIAINFIGGLVALLVVKFLDWSKNYFSEFEKNNLILAMKINNGIVSAIEWLANAIRWVFTLGTQGLGTDDQFELGRFQEDIILEAFDAKEAVKQNVEAGIESVDELVTAQREYEQAFKDSFMTNAEFEAIKQIKDQNNTSFKEVLISLETAGQVVGLAVDSGATQVVSFTDRAMGALSDALEYVEEQANKLRKKSSSSSSSKSYTSYGPDEYAEAKGKIYTAIKDSYGKEYNFSEGSLGNIFTGG